MGSSPTMHSFVDCPPTKDAVLDKNGGLLSPLIVEILEKVSLRIDENY
jgi:hypothetical protein